MKKINIYVGRTDTQLVLKYSTELGEKKFADIMMERKTQLLLHIF